MYRVMWDAESGEWVLAKEATISYLTKEIAVKRACELADLDANPDRSWRRTLTVHPAQVVIHKKNGQIQSERTYPRKSDPRRSKG